MTLKDYFQKNIFTPLGITDTTFSISSRPDLEARVAVRQIRQRDGTYLDDATNLFKIISDKYQWGGGGLYSTAHDYLRLLQSLLSDDGPLLRSETIDELLSPQVQDEQIFNNIPPKSVAQSFSSKRKIAGPLQHSLCGFMGSKTSELGRSGSFNEWCGATNVYWVRVIQSQ
jgi:CubicO group peptidase (beta-lactamase class C family)